MWGEGLNSTNITKMSNWQKDGLRYFVQHVKSRFITEFFC